MAKKYKASKRKVRTNAANADKLKKQALIGRGRIALALIFGTALAAGVYIAAMNAHIAAVFHIYWIITGVLLCVFAFSSRYNKYLYTKNTSSDGSVPEKEKERYVRQLKKLKCLLLVLLPFLFTVIGDTIYVLFLSELPVFDALKSVLSA